MHKLQSANFRVDSCSKLDQNEQIPMALVEIVSTTQDITGTNSSNTNTLRLQFNKDQLRNMNDRLELVSETLQSIK